MTELRQLTSARGIAAWFVVLYHLRPSIGGLPPVVGAILAKGYLAVDFFFLLSGFVIWLTWHERLRGGGLAAVPRFLQKRIARIWPLHVAMLGFAAMMAAALAASGRSDPAFPFADLPFHVLLVQNWGFTRELRWNDPAWSISCELAAYLLFPLLAMATDWRRIPMAALIVVAAGVLLALHAVMAPAPTLGTDITRFGLARCLAEFAVGTIVAALWERGAGCWAAVASAILLAAWAFGTAETLAVPAALACALLALARAPWLLRGQAVHWLGERSYAAYLAHFLLWKAVKLAFVPDPTHVPPATILAYLTLLLAVSALLYRGCERPAQRLVNQLGMVARPLRPALPPVHP